MLKEQLSRQELLELMDARVMWEETHVDEEGNEYAIGVAIEDDPYADLSAVSGRVGLRTPALYRDAGEGVEYTDGRMAITNAEIRLICRLCRESGNRQKCCEDCGVFQRKLEAMHAGLKSDGLPLNPCGRCPLFGHQCGGHKDYLDQLNQLGGPVKVYKMETPPLHAIIGDDPVLAMKALQELPAGAGVVVPLETAAEAAVVEHCLQHAIPVYIITATPRDQMPLRFAQLADVVQKSGHFKAFPDEKSRNQILASLAIQIHDATLFSKKSVATLTAILKLHNNQ